MSKSMPLPMSVILFIDLVARNEGLRELWLLGSRANNTATEESDWDFLAFADDDVLGSLRKGHAPEGLKVDLLVVTDGANFEDAWPTSGEKKSGSLKAWDWKLISDEEATYVSNKWRVGKIDSEPAKAFCLFRRSTVGRGQLQIGDAWVFDLKPGDLDPRFKEPVKLATRLVLQVVAVETPAITFRDGEGWSEAIHTDYLNEFASKHRHTFIKFLRSR